MIRWNILIIAQGWQRLRNAFQLPLSSAIHRAWKKWSRVGAIILTSKRINTINYSWKQSLESNTASSIRDRIFLSNSNMIILCLMMMLRLMVKVRDSKTDQVNQSAYSVIWNLMPSAYFWTLKLDSVLRLFLKHNVYLTLLQWGN